MRIFVVGQVAMEGTHGAVHQHDLPGRQGRLLLSYLVVERRPVARGELVELLWPAGAPDSSDVALNAVVSKLRSVLRRIESRDTTIASRTGGYELRLPAGTWVDYDIASEALHRAEAADRAVDYTAVWGEAGVAYQIAKRQFLTGDDGEWIDQCRARLRGVFVQAAQLLADISLANHETGLAIRLAEEILALEPYREQAYRVLMRAHLLTGNRADAVLAFERCRKLFSEELGIDPAPETLALHLEVLSV